MLLRLRARAIRRPSRHSSISHLRCYSSQKSQSTIDHPLKRFNGENKLSNSEEKDKVSQREQLTTTKQLNDSVLSFRDELLVPSFHMNYRWFEFKVNLTSCENREETIPKLKILIEDFLKECGSADKLEKVMYRLEPIITQILVSIDDSSFVDLFTFLSYRGIKINDENVTSKFIKVLESNISLQCKYNLLFCDQKTLLDSELQKSFLHTPLTKDLASRIAHSYSTSIIKAIIHSFYLPLRDINKINEYIDILYMQKLGNPDKLNPFKCFINLLLDHHKLGVQFSRKDSISYLCGILTSLTRTEIEIPSDFSVNSWHELLITNYFQQLSPATMYNYLEIFYNDFLPEELNYLKKPWEFRPLNDDLKWKVSFLRSRENEVPASIQTLFFDKIIFEEDTKTIRLLVKTFRSMKIDTSAKQAIKDAFRFSILKYALRIRERKQSLFQHLMEYIKEEEFILPKFEKIQLQSVFDYYEGNFSGFIYYLNSANRSTEVYKSLDTQEVIFIADKLERASREVFLQTLIKNNFVFSDNRFIKEWVKENPRLANYILSGGRLNPDMKGNDIGTELSFFRVSTLLTPNEILRLVVEYDTDPHLVWNVLSSYKVYSSDFDYACAQLKVHTITRGKVDIYFDILFDFMKKHKLDSKAITNEQKFRLYTIFIGRVMDLNHLNGLIVASALIPSLKKQIFRLSGMTDSLSFNLQETKYIITEEYEIPVSMIKQYVTRYADSKYMNGKLWATMFKNVLITGCTLKDKEVRETLFSEMFKYFQINCVEKMLNPLTLIKIYQIAESFKMKPEWKVQIDMGNYLESFFSTNNEGTASTGFSIRELISMIAKYESNVKLSSSLVSRLFAEVPNDERNFFLVSLRNLMLNVPFAENVHNYVHSQFEANDPEIYKLFGLEIDNPLTNNPKCKRPKWMRFDVRYFSPLLEIYMKDIITKEQNISIRHMMADSLATMRDGPNSDSCVRFYKMFSEVVLFGNTQVIPSQDIDAFITEFKRVFQLSDANQILPEYLIKPFTYHFLYTRMFTYDLKTIIKLLYILTKGDRFLAENGFWEIGEKSEFVELDEKFGNISLSYQIDGDTDLMSLYRLVFAAAKNTSEVSAGELTYIINISENLIKSESISKRSKYWIMNCTLILVGKHSDLLSAFYKKSQQLLPEYKVTNTVIAELLYSTITNDIRDIDSMLDYMIDTHETHVMHQSCESVIKRLIAEEQNGLAQELYVKYTERKPRFKIPDLNDTLSWAKARQPVVTIDSNDGVNMKMDKFKVKLYDYDSLDKQKS